MRYLKKFEKVGNYFGHDLETLLDMIHGRVDDPMDFIMDKINTLISIRDRKDIVLYRVVWVDNPDKINKNNLGHHYVGDLDDFHEEMMNYLYTNSRKSNPKLDEWDDAYLIKIKTPTSNIDYWETLRTYALHPFENEITIKDDTNIKVVSIEEFYD